MSDQNRKYYSRNNEIIKDEIIFKISDTSDHLNKFLVEKIETKDKKKFIKQYKLDKNCVENLVEGLNKKNIKIISSIYNRKQIENNIISSHPEYSNGSFTHLDSYKKTLTAKFNDSQEKSSNSFSPYHLDGYETFSGNFSQIN